MKKILILLLLAMIFFVSKSVSANNDSYEDHPDGYKINHISETSVNLKWDTNCSTNENFYYKVEGSNQENQRVANCYEKPFSSDRECQMVLNNLDPMTRYYFSNRCGNQSYDFENYFVTLRKLDDSNIEVLNISDDSATIKWMTTNAYRSKVHYFPENNTFNKNTISSDDTSLLHEITLTGLTSNTKYKYKVTSSAFGSGGVISDYLYFSTLDTPSVPVIPPDLTVTDIDFSASTMNEEGILSVTIKNLGGDLNNTSGLLNWYNNFSAQNFVYSSQTPSINNYNTNRSLPNNSNPLKEGDSIVFSWHGKFNTQGNLYLHFTVNNNNELEESDTTNNTYTTSINVSPEPESPTAKPDLVPSGISIREGNNKVKTLNRDPIAGEKFYVRFSYKNIGEIKTDNTPFDINVYVNDNFEKQIKATNNDFLVDLGGSMGVDEMLELSLPAGLHKIKYVLDVDNQVEESNTTNNSYTTTINVKAEEKLNEIEKINKRSENLLHGKVDELLSEINELRNQVREQETQIKYLQNLTLELSKVSVEMQTAINTFITYGVDDNTRRLGEGERAAVINSFKLAYGNLPNSEEELSDVIKIANGRWPSKTSITTENRAKQEFVNIYKREANMDNPHDNAAITIMAYGLRQRAENRNLNSEAAGLTTFRNIYGGLPQSTEDWNILQAITYSGAAR